MKLPSLQELLGSHQEGSQLPQLPSGQCPTASTGCKGAGEGSPPAAGGAGEGLSVCCTHGSTSSLTSSLSLSPQLFQLCLSCAAFQG